MTTHEEELARLLDLLARVGEACSRQASKDEARRYATGFAFKLSSHAISALTLLRDRSALAADGHRFLDRTSVSVLARAGWECSLLFHHVFIAPAGDEDERRARYLRWSIESPRKRQGFETLLPGQAEQLAAEKQEIEAVEAEIRANAAFLRHSQKQQEEFLNEGGRWRPGWGSMAETAGITKLYAKDHYAYLCDHAHTGRFSVQGLQGSLSNDEEMHLREAVGMTLAVAAANVIEGLRQLFPEPPTLAAEDARLVDRWVQAGRRQ